MKIGELSHTTGVSIPTIRLYEREGLIGPAERTAGQSRVFSEEHEKRLDCIKRLRNLGLSMEEVRLLIGAAPASPDFDRTAAAEKILRGLDDRARDLARLREQLSSVLADGGSLERVQDTFKPRLAERAASRTR